MKQSRRGLNDFEGELQGKLNQINQRKSNKKIKIKQPMICQQRCKNQLDHSTLIHQNNGGSNHYEDIKQHHLNQSPQSNKQTNKISCLKSQQSLEEKTKQISNSEYSAVSNKQLYNFLTNFQQNNSSIDLSYFLAKSLALYSSQSDLSEEQIKQIFLLLQSEITTTDPNTVSINALELAIKKKGDSFKMYIIDKIMKGKLIVEGNRIRDKERIVQKSIYETEQNLKNKEKQLWQKQKILGEREKSIIRKQKQNSNKQKQLIQRIKNSKKILQQRAQKLSQQHLSQLQSIYDKMQKKIHSYERNMRSKIQNIGQKLNEMHRLKQIKQTDVKIATIKEIQEKYDKIYTVKNKKYQNEINDLLRKQQGYKKSIKQLQDENKGLMKVSTKLQSKLNKQQNKLKEMMLELQTKFSEIKQLKCMIEKKNKQNDEIMNKLCKIGKSNHKKEESEHDGDDDSNKYAKQCSISKSKSKKQLSSKKKISHQKRNTMTLQVDEIVDVYEIALEICALQSKVVVGYNLKYMKQMLELSTKLYLNYEKQCKQLITLVYQGITTNTNKNTMKYHKENNHSKLLPFLAQMQSYYPRQSSEMIYKYYVSLQNKKNKEKQEIGLWKFLVVFCLLSPNGEQSYCWLKAISEIQQNDQVASQMKDIIFGEHKDCNFIFAIVSKLFIPNHSIDLHVLDLISDLILNMKLVGQQIYSQFWHDSNMGILLIKDYTVIVRNILQNQTEGKLNQMEQIERVSILIQRLVVGYNISIKTQYCQYLDKLRRKCRGTLLERNLNSILESYDAKTEQILKELDDV